MFLLAILSSWIRSNSARPTAENAQQVLYFPCVLVPGYFCYADGIVAASVVPIDAEASITVVTVLTSTLDMNRFIVSPMYSFAKDTYIIDCLALYCQPDTTKDRDKILISGFHLCLNCFLILQRSHLPYHSVRHPCHVRIWLLPQRLLQIPPWNMPYA